MTSLVAAVAAPMTTEPARMQIDYLGRGLKAFTRSLAPTLVENSFVELRSKTYHRLSAGPESAVILKEQVFFSPLRKSCNKKSTALIKLVSLSNATRYVFSGA